MGGVAFLAAAVGLVLFLLARRRKNHKFESNTQDSAEKWLPPAYREGHALHEMPHDAKPAEMPEGAKLAEMAQDDRPVEMQGSGVPYRNSEVHELPEGHPPRQSYKSYRPGAI